MAGMNWDYGVISSIIVAVGALITALATKRKAKTQGEALTVSITEKVLKIANAEIEKLTGQVDDMEMEMRECKSELQVLRVEVSALRRENKELKDGIERLCYQIKSRGETPVWDPALMDRTFVQDL